MAKKQRLDALLAARGLAANIDEARRLIGAGLVLVDEQRADKAGMPVAEDARLSVKRCRRYVSRGGDKLEAALAAFSVDPTGLVCADIGASTGGFTDCLLQHGAARVYAVDVGYGILDWKLRSDSRVIVRERVNARNLTREHIPEPIDLAVLDASFISLVPLLPPLLPLFAGPPRILALVKPQFQLERGKVGQGGIVRDPALHAEAVAMVRDFAEETGLKCAEPFACPVVGARGNREFFLWLTG